MPATLEKTTAEEMMEGARYADPAIGGINDAFDKLFDPQDAPSTPPVAPQEPSKEPEPTKVPETTPEPEKTPTPEKKAVEVEEIKIDDDFFEEDAPVKEVAPEAKTGFDEEAFDKETEETTKGMESKAGDKFKALRNELKEAKQKTITPEVEKKLSELELKASEADGLRQRMEELATQSAKIKVETSDEFDRDVRKPVDGLYAKAEELAALYEGDAQLLWGIVTERDRKKQNELIKEHLGEFSDFDKSEVYRMSQDFSGLLNKRQEMLQDADRYIQKIEADRIVKTEQALQESRKMVQTHLKSIWDKYKETIPGLLDENGKETEVLKSMRNRTMSLDFSKAGVRDMALAAFSGVMVKHLAGEINGLRRQIAEYEAGDEKALKGRPGTGGSVNAAVPTKPSDEPASFMDRFSNANFD